MRSKLKPVLLGTFGLAYAGIAVLLFLPNTNVPAVFAFFLFVVSAIELTGEAPVAFVLTAVATALGVFGLRRLPEHDVLWMAGVILTLWLGALVIQMHLQRLRANERREKGAQEEAAEQSQSIRREIDFYEKRKLELAARAAQRHQLSSAARDLSSAFDAEHIQAKLLESAGRLFPGRPLRLSNGQDFDAIDAQVVQKKQPLHAPNLLAAPIFMQKNVVGVIRVGGESGAAFTKDDLRLLDILAGLASMALDNMLLFSQVQETALRDGLTGLLTIRAFQDQLQSAVLEASRYGQPMSIILADVDHFKSVNDTYGHQAGDQILQGFAHVLDRNVRPGVDIVARYGGEEFIVLLLQTPHDEAVQIAERIRQDLAAIEFEGPSRTLSITSSFGVASFPDDATSGQQLVRQADQRLYRAKEAGRNRVQGR